MSELTLFLIRHAEKPAGAIRAIDENGRHDPESLTARGWQRAGAWAQLFHEPLGGSPTFPSPTAIYASDPRQGGSSRPLETVTPLAALLGLEVDLRFTKGQEPELAEALQQEIGAVLVCWQHESISAIGLALEATPEGLPDNWPDDCFNAIYRLERTATGWRFDQLMPLMLDGDRPSFDRGS